MAPPLLDEDLGVEIGVWRILNKIHGAVSRDLDLLVYSTEDLEEGQRLALKIHDFFLAEGLVSNLPRQLHEAISDALALRMPRPSEE